MNVLQKRLFCVVKEPVLRCKSAYIAMQNRHFCKSIMPLLLFNNIVIVKQHCFYRVVLGIV